MIRISPSKTADTVWSRLASGREARRRFVESNLSKHLAFQIRSLRDKEEWSQGELAAKVGMNQNAISRLENPFYGKPTLTTLKRIASAFDVALMVRFVPFSQLVDWVSGEPYIDPGLTPETTCPIGFSVETKIPELGPGDHGEALTPPLAGPSSRKR